MISHWKNYCSAPSGGVKEVLGGDSPRFTTLLIAQTNTCYSFLSRACVHEQECSDLAGFSTFNTPKGQLRGPRL